MFYILLDVLDNWVLGSSEMADFGNKDVIFEIVGGGGGAGIFLCYKFFSLFLRDKLFIFKRNLKIFLESYNESNSLNKKNVLLLELRPTNVLRNEERFHYLSPE